MDEITLINLLNKICEKNRKLTWKLNCKYHDGINTSIMQISLLKLPSNKQTGTISFRMETGKIIRGNHKGLVPFGQSTSLIDALLDILYYESTKNYLNPSHN